MAPFADETRELLDAMMAPHPYARATARVTLKHRCLRHHPLLAQPRPSPKAQNCQAEAQPGTPVLAEPKPGARVQEGEAGVQPGTPVLAEPKPKARAQQNQGKLLAVAALSLACALVAQAKARA